MKPNIIRLTFTIILFIIILISIILIIYFVFIKKINVLTKQCTGSDECLENNKCIKIKPGYRKNNDTLECEKISIIKLGNWVIDFTNNKIKIYNTDDYNINNQFKLEGNTIPIGNNLLNNVNFFIEKNKLLINKI